MWSLDDSIIKSLKICTNHPRLCDGCIYSKAHMIKYECITGLNGAALALIERQKAEIERLNAMVAPVKHGKWELCFEDSRRQIEGNKCSVCGYEYYGNKYFYCPNCGARMDGDTT